MGSTGSYQHGEGFSDEGYLTNLELHLRPANFADHVRGQAHLFGFVDTRRISATAGSMLVELAPLRTILMLLSALYPWWASQRRLGGVLCQQMT